MRFNVRCLFCAVCLIIFGFFTPVMAQTDARAANLFVSGTSGSTTEITQVLMGSQNIKLASIVLSSGRQDIVVNSFPFQEKILTEAGVSYYVGFFHSLNFSLRIGGTPIAAQFNVIANKPRTQYYNVVLASPLQIPKATTITLEVFANTSRYQENSQPHGLIYQAGIFELEKPFSAKTTTGGSVSVVVNSLNMPVGAKMKPIRSIATCGGNMLGNSANRVSSSADDLGLLTVAADKNGNIGLEKIVVEFGGNFPFSQNYLQNNCRLVEENTFTVIQPTAIEQTSVGSWRVTFQVVQPYLFVSAGTQVNFRLRINSLVAPEPPHGRVLSAAVASCNYVDATDGNGIDLEIPSSQLPVLICSVRYFQ